jgi:hypothetical protein
MVMTTETMLDSRFASLFRGRTDAYGSEEGGCVKQSVTLELFGDHLLGGEPIGIYPLYKSGGEWMCVWGCSDIDVDDINAALSIKEALGAAGVTAFVERSRSKGYHIWVFADQPVPAAAMRRMFLCAHQVAEYPAREVNPKQESLSDGQFGNYVRLPYWNASDKSAIHRRVLTDDLTPMPLAEFIGRAYATKTPAETIKRLAGYWKPPTPQRQVRVDLNVPESLADALRLLSPLGKVIWRDGPLPERDRSSTLTKLAYECVKSGMSPSECKVVLVDADRRWGKYHLRRNGDLEIDKLVVRVFSR